ncbi:YrhB domain-containing protein [Streptomyces sp. CB03911]|uniref:YrhB domain-containing protein n=1 Tax=Streptomyces sp. CB03911 TaxID=1804758 RepID=UPI002570FA8A|nr:YrhB domain-containing protein [Streptomyces sp. CB03911]
MSEERAVRLVEALLARERPTWAGPEPAVCAVREHAVGWLVFWNSAKFARTRDPRDSLVGSGPYVVDRHDGSIHHVPAATWTAGSWEALYLRQVRGVRPPDPPASSVRALPHCAGVVAAMSHLRKQVPGLGPREARGYVDALRDGAEPPEPAGRTRTQESCPPLPIETLAGPVQ